MKLKFRKNYRAGIGRKPLLAAISCKINKKKVYECPSCSYEKLFHKGTGIYECKKCFIKTSGGAYELV
jgi:ribosomal protein L37AE/L43A